MNFNELNLDECFPGHPSFYFLDSDVFFNSALHLENIANDAGVIWTQEMKKHNLIPGDGFKQVKTTREQDYASRDMRCMSVSKYLYAHSMELLVKGIALYKNGKVNEKHNFDQLVTDVILPLFNEDAINYHKENIKKMGEVIAEILIWSGRYPAPKKNPKPHIADKIRQTIRYQHGYSNPLNLLDIPLLKKFRIDILNLSFTQQMLPKPINLDSVTEE